MRCLPVAALLGFGCADPTPQVGGDAPDVTLVDQHGETVSLHEYAGDVMLVDLSSST